MKYHRLVLSPSARDLWFLDGPRTAGGEEVDPRTFCKCTRWESLAPLSVEKVSGQAARFALGEFDYPVVDRATADLVVELDSDVQLVPLSIAGRASGHQILNVLRRVVCADEEASKFDRFDLMGSRPDLAGQYKTFYRLRLHPTVVPDDAHIFRVAGYEVALVVSEVMKECLITSRANDGVSFVDLT